MSRVEENLSTLGESLPVASKPVANYLGCKRSGNTLYVSGRVSQIRGEVGTDLRVTEAQIAAKGAVLDILAIIKDEIGDLDKVVSVEKLVGFVRSAPAFTEQPKEALIYSLNGYNTDHHVKLHGALGNASTNARR